MKLALAALLLAVAGCSGEQTAAAPAVAETAVGAIPLSGRVVDRADILTPSQESILTAKLEGLERATTDQLVVVTLPSLGQASIEETALALGRGWKVGQADTDNGVLLIVAPNERKVRVEVGYGLEGYLTDQRAAQTVRLMLPKFRQGDLSGAVLTGADDVVAFLEADARRPRYLNEQRRKMAA